MQLLLLQLVHSDLAGPITPGSKEGHKYAMIFVDDYSGAFGVYFLKNKSDTIRATEQFLADTAPYGTVKRLRSDNGGKYVSEEFKSLLLKNHIKHEQSAPYSPHQNGTAERAWRSLFFIWLDAYYWCRITQTVVDICCHDVSTYTRQVLQS